MSQTSCFAVPSAESNKYVLNVKPSVTKFIEERVLAISKNMVELRFGKSVLVKK